ncbi:MAG: branched-chain amino acid ABC transporter permease [Armatimonadota bacterium]|nr:branched-chain amino acid ABC transporter permease [Armatimonadota bacterium]MDR7450978.1 branched-chain amino acid ABC transporter permease [Armatimonadota bacterium]MDR7466001.1 branched-chain amino acid ABC transporter permease [Armatimonadota bacterium]MDR7494066.1 branched-chain amino acid ABC transporter permease [Armatimonadota bacterium]MDR7504067.1 branched-chain amino acid ABC transporter permease [Armatimonadota bacterium]
MSAAVPWDLVAPMIMGALLGGLYALVALGLSLVFGVMKLINVAHGDFVVLGSYAAYAGMSLGLDPILSLLVGVPAFGVLGFLLYRFLMHRASGISAEAPLIVAFGLSIVLQNAIQIAWSPLSRGLTTSYILVSLRFGSADIPLVYLLDLVAALIVMAALDGFLRRTYLGRAVTAASQDARAAQLVGINTDTIHALAFAIATATAAIAGVFLGLTYPFTPSSGVAYLIIAFGVVIIGGLGSMLGTFLGGIILGLAQSLGGHFFGAAAQMLPVYLTVLVLLALRPQGLFGR